MPLLGRERAGKSTLASRCFSALLDPSGGGNLWKASRSGQEPWRSAATGVAWCPAFFAVLKRLTVSRKHCAWRSDGKVPIAEDFRRGAAAFAWDLWPCARSLSPCGRSLRQAKRQASSSSAALLQQSANDPFLTSRPRCWTPQEADSCSRRWQAPRPKAARFSIFPPVRGVCSVSATAPRLLRSRQG